MKDALTSALLGLGIPLLLAGAVILLIHYIVKRQRARRRYSPLVGEMLRMPAHQLRRDLDDLDEPLLLGFLLIFIPALYVLLVARTNVVAWALVALVVIYGATKIWTTLHRALELRLAVDGECFTGQELSVLMRDGAWVFHDIPYQYGNIDHIVVSTGGVFAVETKTYRKPAGKRESSRLAKVTFDGNELVFPHYRMAEPIDQARRHAKHLQQAIQRRLGFSISVIPVVALPGWFVERTGRSDVRVFNPKGGDFLRSAVKGKVMSPAQTEQIANFIESVARSVPAGSKKMDPDAAKYYDFWHEPRVQDRKLD